MRKALSIFLVSVIMIVQLAFALPMITFKSQAAEDDNKCGDSIIWTVDTASGVLTLDGAGKTHEYKIGKAPWDTYADYITSIVVSEGITHLLEGTFNKLNKVESLTLPSTIEEIYTTATLPALENIDFSNGKTLYYVADSFCSKSVWYKNIPNGSLIYFGSLLCGIKGDVPENTSIEIADGTTVIKEKAFYNKTNIVNVIFPYSLKYIGFGAFYNTGWYNSQPDGLVYAGSVLLVYKGTMPSTDSVCSVKEGTKGIAANAFSDNRIITGITIPSTVEEIGVQAFSQCLNLSKVIIENNSLLKRIHARAFYGCYEMKEFEIPETVVEIGDEVFTVTGLKYVYIPASVQKLDGAFSQSSKAEFFEVSPNNLNYCSDSDGVVFSKDKTVLYNVPAQIGKTEYTVPSDVHYIYDEAFAYSYIEKVIFNDELQGTGESLFRFSSYVKELDLGKGLTVICKNMFCDAWALKEIVIPKSIKCIESGGLYSNRAEKIYILSEDVVFEGRATTNSKTVIYCYTNSTAHKHAEEYGINYVLFDDEHYTYEIDKLLLKAEGIHRSDYTDESLAELDTVLNKIDLEAEGLTQYQIDDWCEELETAIDNLKIKSVDFSKVDEAIEKAEKINRSLYSDESLGVLDEAIDSVDRNANDSEIISAYADAIESAISNLKYKPADYSLVMVEIEKAEKLNRRYYSEISLIVLDTAINSVEYNLDITHQSEVDLFAQTISEAISALQYASIVLRHEPCGVIVSATTKEIKPDTILTVESIDPSNYEGTNFAVGGSIRSLSFYDINLVYDTVIVQPDGTVTVKIKLKDGVDPAKCKVYHVTEDIVNPLVRFASTIDGNYIVFETEHFSEFAVIEVETVLDGIEIAEYPEKAEYKSGENLDLAGMEIVAHYSDGTSKEITDYIVSMVDMQSAGTKKVTFYYTFGNVTKSAEFSITVVSVVADITIRTPSTSKIKYGDSIWLHAEIEGDLPAGAKIVWAPSNNNFEVVEVSADGLSCKITPKSSGTTTFTASVVDENEIVLITDTQDMTAKAGLWQKIVAFFKKIFGVTKTYPELYKGIF